MENPVPHIRGTGFWFEDCGFQGGGKLACKKHHAFLYCD